MKLTIANSIVDQWNKNSQGFNPANNRIFKSKDLFEKVRHEEGTLNLMLSEEIYSSYKNHIY